MLPLWDVKEYREPPPAGGTLPHSRHHGCFSGLALLQLNELAATCHRPLVADVDQEPDIAEKISS